MNKVINNELKLEMKNVLKGLYLLTIETNEGIFKSKIIKN